MWKVIREDELYHHGIKGQKWGVRRFQNPDGTLTAAGRKRLYKKLKSGSRAGYTDMTNEQRDRMESEHKRYMAASLAYAKADNRLNYDIKNKLVKKYGDPSKLDKHRYKEYEAEFYDELGKESENKRKRDIAAGELDRVIDEYAEMGRRVSEELLGKYSGKKFIDSESGMRITAGERLVKDLIGFLP